MGWILCLILIIYRYFVHFLNEILVISFIPLYVPPKKNNLSFYYFYSNFH